MPFEKIDDPVNDGDVVLVHIDEEPAFFVRIEGFSPDRKRNWWQVKMLILKIPLQEITWVLRREQVNGEPFTMEGRPIWIEKVRAPVESGLSVAETEDDKIEKAAMDNESAKSHETAEESSRPARILSLGSRRDETDGTS